MSDFKEIELKYKADNIKLTAFTTLMSELKYSSTIEVSSWDSYFVDKEGNPGRFRNSSLKPEFTIKKKTNPLNNQNRYELNIPLATGIKEEIVDEAAKQFGFTKDFKIFKNCFIYFFEYVDIVFYLVYNEDMKEEGRFLEIEFLEDRLKEVGEDKAFEIIKEYEQKLAVLGLSPQNRLKKSLFEMFKK